MEIVFFAGLGLIIGSFLNVLILREGEEGLGGRSHCPGCRHTLSALDLIPVASWVLLRGRCRYCKASISLQYPIVELLTAGLFVIIGVAEIPLLARVVGLLIAALCIAIAAYDFRHLLIPDDWNYGFIVSAFVFGALLPANSVIEQGIAGLITALPLWALWYFSGGRWMGFGDVKFALGIGWLLGLYNGLVALLGAFIIGALVSVCILLPLGAAASYAQKRGISWLSVGDKHFTMNSEVPFGPFLIISCLTIWLLTIHGIALPF